MAKRKPSKSTQKALKTRASVENARRKAEGKPRLSPKRAIAASYARAYRKSQSTRIHRVNAARDARGLPPLPRSQALRVSYSRKTSIGQLRVDLVGPIDARQPENRQYLIEKIEANDPDWRAFKEAAEEVEFGDGEMRDAWFSPDAA